MAINSIVVDPNNNASGKPNLTLILATGLIPAVYELRDDLDPGYDFANPGVMAAEVGVEISWANETGFTENENGGLITFDSLTLRAALKRVDVGDQSINITVTPLDTTVGAADNSLTIESAPAKMYNALVNKVTEKVRVKLSGKNSVFINRLILWAAQRTQLRPRA